MSTLFRLCDVHCTPMLVLCSLLVAPHFTIFDLIVTFPIFITLTGFHRSIASGRCWIGSIGSSIFISVLYLCNIIRSGGSFIFVALIAFKLKKEFNHVKIKLRKSYVLINA